nr:hypothetical protein [Streptomyces sp. S1D4-11]QIY92959.1 hypothetical protein HEP87_00155 [Streptomyces sp. S1D4-11]
MGDAQYHQQNLHQLYNDMGHDDLAGEGIFASGGSSTRRWPYAEEGPANRDKIWNHTERKEAQERAHELLLRSLTEEQADALLICSMDKDVLDDLIGALWKQYQRGVIDGAPKIVGT